VINQPDTKPLVVEVIDDIQQPEASYVLKAICHELKVGAANSIDHTVWGWLGTIRSSDFSSFRRFLGLIRMLRSSSQ
jgi:hypothetical protein